MLLIFLYQMANRLKSVATPLLNLMTLSWSATKTLPSSALRASAARLQNWESSMLSAKIYLFLELSSTLTICFSFRIQRELSNLQALIDGLSYFQISTGLTPSSWQIDPDLPSTTTTSLTLAMLTASQGRVVQSFSSKVLFWSMTMLLEVRARKLQPKLTTCRTFFNVVYFPIFNVPQAQIEKVLAELFLSTSRPSRFCRLQASETANISLIFLLIGKEQLLSRLSLNQSILSPTSSSSLLMIRVMYQGSELLLSY